MGGGVEGRGEAAPFLKYKSDARRPARTHTWRARKSRRHQRFVKTKRSAALSSRKNVQCSGGERGRLVAHLPGGCFGRGRGRVQ